MRIQRSMFKCFYFDFSLFDLTACVIFICPYDVAVLKKTAHARRNYCIGSEGGKGFGLAMDCPAAMNHYLLIIGPQRIRTFGGAATNIHPLGPGKTSSASAGASVPA